MFFEFTKIVKDCYYSDESNLINYHLIWSFFEVAVRLLALSDEQISVNLIAVYFPEYSRYQKFIGNIITNLNFIHTIRHLTRH